MFNICKAITIGSYSTPLDKLICKKLALILKKLLPYRMKDPVHFMTDDDLRGGGLEGLLYTLSTQINLLTQLLRRLRLILGKTDLKF